MIANLTHPNGLSGSISVSTETTEINRLVEASWVGLPGWVVMWGILVVLVLVAKGFVLRRAWRAGVGPFAWDGSGGAVSWERPLLWSVAFTLLWPGMEVAEFRDRATRCARAMDWRGLCAAVAKTMFGVGLLWGLARHCGHPLLAGWVGMIGVVFILHFGLFHVAAILWRRRGLNLELVMRWPVGACSAGDFWSRRWNRPFNDFALRFWLRPLARRWGWALATLAIFLVSGLVHELVISLPARAGWGLPTGYFVIQGLAILAERRWGIGGHSWTIAVVAGPAFWLFHPPFVLGVIVPLFLAIGALPVTSPTAPP